MAAVVAAAEEAEVPAAHLRLFEVPPGVLRKNHTLGNIDY